MQEIKITLSDEAFQIAKEHAARNGFESTEAFLEDLVESGVSDDQEIEMLFTPEVMAKIDEGIRDADQGRVFSLDEIDAYFTATRKAWRENHAS